MANENLKYSLTEDSEIESRVLDEEEIKNLREVWFATSADEKGFRSCWECNGAHAHLIRDDYMFRCFGCGRVYVHGADVTDYS